MLVVPGLVGPGGEINNEHTLGRLHEQFLVLVQELQLRVYHVISLNLGGHEPDVLDRYRLARRARRERELADVEARASCGYNVSSEVVATSLQKRDLAVGSRAAAQDRRVVTTEGKAGELVGDTRSEVR